MRLVVESGATKTAWRALADDGTMRSVQTVGLSPTCLDMDTMQSIVREAIPSLNPEGKIVDEIYFYGAGLVSQAAAGPVLAALELWCPFAQIHFYSDLHAASRALFGDGSGIVAIMGTGSNSCLYENGEIVRNIRPGGYILGDEGSASALGKAFLADYIKGLLPESVEEAFVKDYGLDYATIVRKVYKEPSANAFLASLAPFIMSWASDTYIGAMVEECLDAFVKRTLVRYSDSSAQKKVGVVGSFGFACQDIIKRIGLKYNLEFVKFLKSPVDELVAYHTSGNTVDYGI